MLRPQSTMAMFAFGCLLLVAGAVAQEEQRASFHPLTNMPGDAPGIETTYFFPEHTSKPKFPAGAPVEVLVGFHNGAAQPYNVSAIMGSLNSPLDFGIYVQNFTLTNYGLKVEPDGQASLLYSFKPDAALHPREFTVALTVFYINSQGAMSTTTFFNSTIEIVEAPRTIDGEILFLWAMLLGAVGFAGYKAYTFVQKFVFKGSKKSSKKAAPPADISGEEWLEGTAIGAERKRAAKAAQKTVASKTE